MQNYNIFLNYANFGIINSYFPKMRTKGTVI